MKQCNHSCCKRAIILNNKKAMDIVKKICRIINGKNSTSERKLLYIQTENGTKIAETIVKSSFKKPISSFVLSLIYYEFLCDLTILCAVHQNTPIRIKNGNETRITPKSSIVIMFLLVCKLIY